MYKSKSKSYEKIWAGTNLTYVKENVTFNKNYYFKLRTYKKTPYGKIYGTLSDKITVRLEHPEKITGLKASAKSDGSIKLSFAADKNASMYQIYRSTDPNGKFKRIKSTQKLTYSDADTTPGQYYFYKVRAYIKVGDKKYYGEWSDVITVKTKINNTTFKASEDYDNKSIKIKIKKDKSVTGYILYMYKSKSKSYEKIWAGTNLTYVKENVTFNKNYYFKLRTYKKNPYGKIYSPLSDKITVRLEHPEKITGLKASAKLDGSIKLSFAADKNASMYQIYRSTDPNGKFKRIKSTQKLTYSDKNTASGKSYYYKVRAYIKVDDKKYYGEWSDVVKKKAK